jgi:hypothetical protein
MTTIVSTMGWVLLVLVTTVAIRRVPFRGVVIFRPTHESRSTAPAGATNSCIFDFTSITPTGRVLDKGPGRLVPLGVMHCAAAFTLVSTPVMVLTTQIGRLQLCAN